LQFGGPRSILCGVTQPLALIVYEKLLPGTQLVNRLQDLKYRVRAVTEPSTLIDCARQEKPLIVLADVFSSRNDLLEVIRRLKQSPETQHIPVIAFTADQEASRRAALEAGATLVVGDTAILNHLPQLLEQALRVE
jgi:CheY-like chemotaxis protein